MNTPSFFVYLSISANSKSTKLDSIRGTFHQTVIGDYSAVDTTAQDGSIVTLRTDYFITFGNNTRSDYRDDDQNTMEQLPRP